MTSKWSGLLPQNQSAKERWQRIETRWILPGAPKQIPVTIRETEPESGPAVQEFLSVGVHEDDWTNGTES